MSRLKQGRPTILTNFLNVHIVGLMRRKPDVGTKIYWVCFLILAHEEIKSLECRLLFPFSMLPNIPPIFDGISERLFTFGLENYSRAPLLSLRRLLEIWEFMYDSPCMQLISSCSPCGSWDYQIRAGKFFRWDKTMVERRCTHFGIKPVLMFQITEFIFIKIVVFGFMNKLSTKQRKNCAAIHTWIQMGSEVAFLTEGLLIWKPGIKGLLISTSTLILLDFLLLNLPSPGISIKRTLPIRLPKNWDLNARMLQVVNCVGKPKKGM